MPLSIQKNIESDQGVVNERRLICALSCKGVCHVHEIFCDVCRRRSGSNRDIRANTGFDFDTPAEVPVTEVPDAETLGLIRGPVAEQIAEIYPSFAERVFGRAA